MAGAAYWQARWSSTPASVLAIIAVGVAAMVGDSVQMRYGLKELLPRVAVGFVPSAFAVPLTGVPIDVANALAVSLTGASAPAAEAVTFVRSRVAHICGHQLGRVRALGGRSRPIGRRRTSVAAVVLAAGGFGGAQVVVSAGGDA